MTYRLMDMHSISPSVIFSSFVLLGSGVRNTVSASDGDEVISFCRKTNVQLFLEGLSSEKLSSSIFRFFLVDRSHKYLLFSPLVGGIPLSFWDLNAQLSYLFLKPIYSHKSYLFLVGKKKQNVYDSHAEFTSTFEVEISPKYYNDIN